MVLGIAEMEGASNNNRERRTSSPIGIPNAKLSALSQTHQKIVEDSPEISPPISHYLPVLSSSLPAASSTHAKRILSEGNQTNTQENLSPEFGSLERLPEGSEAFSAVFGQLVQSQTPDESQHGEGNAPEGEKGEKTQDTSSNNKGGSPRRVRKDMQKLKFAIENLQVRSSPSTFRKRAASASSHRKIMKSTKEMPNSTHCTPALRRKKKDKEEERLIINVIPKYKFLTETITVSHEDLVREQEEEAKLKNGYSSPKSIFGIVDNLEGKEE